MMSPMKPSEVLAGIESGRLTVERGLRELSMWRNAREFQRRRESACRRLRPARWLRIRIETPEHRHRFSLWIPCILIRGALSFAGFAGSTAMSWGRSRRRRWITEASRYGFELSPRQVRQLTEALRRSLVAVGKMVEVNDGDTRVEIWLT